LSAAVAFDQHAALAVGAPVLLTVVLLAVTYPLGRLAPSARLGWLFATPGWVERLAGAPRPAAATNPAPSTVQASG
jgi:hypothetical protein